MLAFNESDHRYEFEGRVVPSVTTVIQSVLPGRWMVDPYYLDRGRIIHLACQYEDQGGVEEDSIDAVVVPYYQAYRKFKADTGFSPEIIEGRYYHKTYQYAGTLDRVGILNGKTVLIDLKSGCPYCTDQIQLAAYAELLFYSGLIPIQKFDLYLKDDGNYKLIERPKKREDLNLFLSALNVYRWKKENCI
jgi:hypothetical protein